MSGRDSGRSAVPTPQSGSGVILQDLQPGPLLQTTASAALTRRFQLQIIGAFRTRRALSGATARRLRDLGLRDSQALRELIAGAVIRKAGPERYFLDETAWASRRDWPVWQLLLVVLGVFIALGLGAAVLSLRPW